MYSSRSSSLFSSSSQHQSRRPSHGHGHGNHGDDDDTPLTAERAMMDQIRSKLEKAQRRLAREQSQQRPRSGYTSSSSAAASGSRSTVGSTRYYPPDYSSHKTPAPAIKSMYLEDLSLSLHASSGGGNASTTASTRTSASTSTRKSSGHTMTYHAPKSRSQRYSTGKTSSQAPRSRHHGDHDDLDHDLHHDRPPPSQHRRDPRAGHAPPLSTSRGMGIARHGSSVQSSRHAPDSRSRLARPPPSGSFVSSSYLVYATNKGSVPLSAASYGRQASSSSGSDADTRARLPPPSASRPGPRRPPPSSSTPSKSILRRTESAADMDASAVVPAPPSSRVRFEDLVHDDLTPPVSVELPAMDGDVNEEVEKADDNTTARVTAVEHESVAKGKQVALEEDEAEDSGPLSESFVVAQLHAEAAAEATARTSVQAEEEATIQAKAKSKEEEPTAHSPRGQEHDRQAGVETEAAIAAPVEGSKKLRSDDKAAGIGAVVGRPRRRSVAGAHALASRTPPLVTSPLATRKSLTSLEPPKSEIKVSAFRQWDLRPRRGSREQLTPTVAKVESKLVAKAGAKAEDKTEDKTENKPNVVAKESVLLSQLEKTDEEKPFQRIEGEPEAAHNDNDNDNDNVVSEESATQHDSISLVDKHAQDDDEPLVFEDDAEPLVYDESSPPEYEAESSLSSADEGSPVAIDGEQFRSFEEVSTGVFEEEQKEKKKEEGDEKADALNDEHDEDGEEDYDEFDAYFEGTSEVDSNVSVAILEMLDSEDEIASANWIYADDHAADVARLSSNDPPASASPAVSPRSPISSSATITSANSQKEPTSSRTPTPVPVVRMPRRSTRSPFASQSRTRVSKPPVSGMRPPISGMRVPTSMYARPAPAAPPSTAGGELTSALTNSTPAMRRSLTSSARKSVIRDGEPSADRKSQQASLTRGDAPPVSSSVAPPPPSSSMTSLMLTVPRSGLRSAMPPSSLISSTRSSVPRSTPRSSYVPRHFRSSNGPSSQLRKVLPPSIGALSGLASGPVTFELQEEAFYEIEWTEGEFGYSFQRVFLEEDESDDDGSDSSDSEYGSYAPRSTNRVARSMYLRMLLNTERGTCPSFRHVRVGDVLIQVGNTRVCDFTHDHSGAALTRLFTRLSKHTPLRLVFQRMDPMSWEGGVEL